MTAQTPGASAASSAELAAARLLLARMGLSAEDLLATPVARPPVPSFAEYIAIVSAAVIDGTRRVYGSYWNCIEERWGHRHLDEPTSSEIKQLVEHVKVNVVARRNARGGRSAGEHLIAALRCLYRHAEDDGFIGPAVNPASKVPKPRRLPFTRRAVADTRLAEINQIGDHRQGPRAAAARPRPRPVPDLPTRERRNRPLATRLADPHGAPRPPRPRTRRPARWTPVHQRPTDHHPPLRRPLDTPRQAPPLGRYRQERRRCLVLLRIDHNRTT